MLKKVTNWIENNLIFHEKEEYQFSLPNVQNNTSSLEEKQEKQEPKKVFPTLSVNLEFFKVKYNSMINSDIKIREFTLNARNKQYAAAIIYIDGMIDFTLLNDFVLKPLMLRNRANTFDHNENRIISEAIANNITVRKVKKFNLADYIYQSLLPQNAITKTQDLKECIDDINMGNCLLLADTLDIAFLLDIKGFKQRSIGEPKNEIVIRGSQEAFTEVIRTNTSLLRRLVNNENLIIESISVGKLSKTKCAVCYMNDIAKPDLVAEVKFRLNNLSIDYLISSGQLEQLIEDNNHSSLPQMLATERPDRAALSLLEGRVVVIVNGSPYILIMPGVFFDMLSSPEDTNLKYQYSNLLKFVRMLGFLIALLLPGLYMAITNFHQELIPTELLFAIVSSRNSVPFPIFVEILAMEISFELIREAGLRVPSPMGTTIRDYWSLNFRTSCSRSKYCKPYFNYCSSLNRNSLFFNSRLFP